MKIQQKVQELLLLLQTLISNMICQMKMLRANKAQQGLAGAFIMILIGVIVGVGVTIPIINQVISNSSITGMTYTILTYLSVMIALVLFISVAGMMTFGKK